LLNQQPVYTGTRVTFNFQDIPVRSALQLIADESQSNIVASDTVGGSVTLRLNNVPWDQALDVILRAKGLDKRQNGNVTWIAPQKELADYEQSVSDARFKAEDTAPLVTTYVPISYGKAQDIAKLLTTGSMQSSSGGGGGSGLASQHRGFLSVRGSVTFDQRTNTLLINDTAEKTVELRAIIAQLDRPVQQVLIESRIVIATDDFERDLGVQWGVSGNRTNPSGQVLQVGSAINGAQGNNGTTSTLGSGGLNVNLPASPTTGSASSIAAAILGKNYALDLELSAAQLEGRSEVVSSPRVITANQQEADIRQGQEIGYVTYQNSVGGGGASGTATVAFKDAVLELKVTPTITADSRVYLSINVNKDSLDHYITVPGSGQVPVIDTRSLNTAVLVDNGQTVVLGGIYEVSKTDSLSKVPGLGDIPGLGVLFRSTQHINDKDELLIFVTPRILSDSLQ
jgi:type IV pilus assembly protein PilQ